ncbi:MAG: sel1 repeat family protein [Candidatus Competibacteraceae bacterium]|nr:sel1 repeat family protein [Candidatus Competibacteraceae bacterium]
MPLPALFLLFVFSLTGCSDSGEVIPPALAELHQRAAAGDASAQLDLGLRYVTGQGIRPDERAALDWIGKAADQGNAAAQFELKLVHSGSTAPRISRGRPTCCGNPPSNFAPAQTSLGMLHLAGQGVPEDRIEAYAWLGLAAERGEREALDWQPGLQAKLSDAELREARRRAEQYRQGPL